MDWTQPPGWTGPIESLTAGSLTDLPVDAQATAEQRAGWGSVENEARTVYAKWGGETGPNLHPTREAAEAFALEKARRLRAICNGEGPERIAPLEWVEGREDDLRIWRAECGAIRAEVRELPRRGFVASVWAEIGEAETPDYLLFSHANPHGLDIGEEHFETVGEAKRFCQETAATLARWAGGLGVPGYTGVQEALPL